MSGANSLQAMPTDFGKRIKTARKHAGLTQKALANKISLAQPSLSHLENSGFASVFTAQIADACGVNPRWLATGEGEMLPVGGTAHATALLDSGALEGAVRVPVLANAASMGGGLDLCAEDVICGELTLTPQFVAEQLRPVRPGALRFIHGYGDSMAPTFNSGDVLLVDTDMREVRIDGIYVLEAHGRLFIKRVRQRLDGRYEISSDNPTHKTVDTLNGDHQVEIKGRVIWAWNGRKL